MDTKDDIGRCVRNRDVVARGCPSVLAPALELYLDLHRSPELSGAEHRTAARLAQELTAAGCTVTTGVGGHGVVGVLINGEGPTVMLRAELDALPVAEQTGLPYASQVTVQGPDGVAIPVMHACGHDMHVAALAGTARLLAAGRRHWRGTLVLVGQPAEETLSGARAMLLDGLYTRFPRPDVALAQHISPFPAGFVAHGSGVMTAASRTLDVVLYGRGGHASMPEYAVNPIDIAADATLRIKEWSAGQRTQDYDRVVAAVGTLHGGVRANILPETAHLGIGLRAFSAERLAEAEVVVRDILRRTNDAAGGTRPPEVTVSSESAPNLNDPEAARAVRRSHAALLGSSRVLDCPPTTAAEDFPLYGTAGTDLYSGPAVPTVYWMVGSVGAKQWEAAAATTGADRSAHVPPNHSPAYAPDPVPTLRTAIGSLSAAALEFLAGAPPTEGVGELPAARRQDCQGDPA